MTVLTCQVMSSLLLMIIPRFLAWVLGVSVSVGPNLVDHQLESHGEVVLQKISTSVLSMLSLRQWLLYS